MTDRDHRETRSWLDKIKLRSGLMSWQQETTIRGSLSAQDDKGGYIGNISSGLKTDGAKQAYERSIAKDKRLQKSTSRDRLLDLPLTELPVVIVDLETTGFEPQADSIISIGGWRISGAQWDKDPMCCFYEEINPGIRIPPHIERLTGITNEQVKDAPSLQEVLIRFLSFVDNRLIIAHGIGHDKAFLRTALWRCQKRTWNYRMLDTMLLAKWLLPETRPFDLDTVLQYCDIPIEDRHHALHDAKATGELWIRFIEQAMSKRVMTLRDMYMYLSRY